MDVKQPGAKVSKDFAVRRDETELARRKFLRRAAYAVPAILATVAARPAGAATVCGPECVPKPP